MSSFEQRSGSDVRRSETNNAKRERERERNE